MAETTSPPVPSDHIMGVYARAPLAFERGEGCRLYTAEGEAYLDCMAGIAVTALGHSHPKLVAAVKDQAEKLWHTSNIFRIPNQEKLAGLLTAHTFADVCFMTNSGAEAIECAIKTARKYHWAKGAPERIDIIGFDGSFHGRTLAAVNASGNASYLEGFGPPMPGFVHAQFGDLEGLRALVGPTTAAIILEPVQGEGGARSWTEAQLREIRQLCDETGTLLIYDEIQCARIEMEPDQPPDGTAVRLRMGRRRRRAGHHGGRQGAGRRLPGRRVPGYDRGGVGDDTGLARLHLRRQPAGDGGRRGVDGRAGEARTAGARPRGRGLSQPAAHRPQGPLSGRREGHPRQGPADRRPARHAEPRVHAACPRQPPAAGRRRRQLRAPAAAADADAGRGARGDRALRGVLRTRASQSAKI